MWTFVPSDRPYAKFYKIILKWANSRQEKFSIYLISEESYVNIKSYTCLMNSFKVIHSFLPKQSKMCLSFTSNSLFKHINMETAIRPQLAKIRPSSVILGQKCTFFILLGFNDSKVLLKYFYIFIFCSVRAFQRRYIDNDNPTVVSDMT